MTQIPKPIHDNPLGLLHPYWARKPQNILDAIISSLSSQDDLVIDPFMGSGTTLFSAMRLNHDCFGSDISPLSQFVVNGTIEILDGGFELLDELRRIYSEYEKRALGWFKYDGQQYIERTRFTVSGDYANGDFSLTPTEYVLKEKKPNGKWGKRQVITKADVIDVKPEGFGNLLESPVSFSSITLPPNSRIAIPEGARLSHYFTEANRACINLLLTMLQKSPMYSKYPDGMRLALSSSIPMLRLSDKKASSQWPYWRPKNNLTSRNPVMVIAGKIDAIEDMLTWAQSELRNFDRTRIRIASIAAQNLTVSETEKPAGLVLTDPPYGDQVPYLEYSNLWNGILELELSNEVYASELVKSDAPFLRGKNSDYSTKLGSALSANLSLIAPNGLAAWFYQDHILDNWLTIYSAANKCGFGIAAVLPIPKQRRSLKTVTTPNRTLDGDLLVVFSRRGDKGATKKIEALIGVLPQLGEQTSYFEEYATVIQDLMTSGDIVDFAKSYRTVDELLKARGD